MNDISFIGWLGAITFVVAYFLLSVGVLTAKRIPYHFLNAVGGICLVINSISLDDPPNFFVNLIWAVIAIYAILRILKLNRKNLVTNTENG